MKHVYAMEECRRSYIADVTSDCAFGTIHKQGQHCTIRQQKENQPISAGSTHHYNAALFTIQRIARDTYMLNAMRQQTVPLALRYSKQGEHTAFSNKWRTNP